ncbi:sugar ABC transporter permease [Candidatus Bathyarchaeota archaeon]|nr:sugar ABC transporter permease [Candidatus Bathyarchaeota archaeon]
MKLSDHAYGVILTLPGIILLVLLIIYPLAQLIHLSLLRYDLIHPVTFIGLNNYKEILSDPYFWRSVEKMLIFASGTTTLTFLISLILAHSLGRITKGAGILRTIIIFPWAVPAAVSGIFWVWMFDPVYGLISNISKQLGFGPISIMLDGRWAMVGVILSDTWVRIPGVTLMLLAGLQSIPQELYDSARVDGADILQTFRHISLPLNKRQMFYTIFITYLFSSRTIDTIVTMTQGGPAKATYVLGYYFFDTLYVDKFFGKAAAVGVVLLIICVAITLTLGRLFMRREE